MKLKLLIIFVLMSCTSSTTNPDDLKPIQIKLKLHGERYSTSIFRNKDSLMTRRTFLRDTTRFSLKADVGDFVFLSINREAPLDGSGLEDSTLTMIVYIDSLLHINVQTKLASYKRQLIFRENGKVVLSN